MTELDPITLRRELMLRNAIEARLDRLVSLATSAALKLSPRTQMEESQLRNLLNAALESRSVEVTTNFIRYQIARKERDWDTSLNGFGHTIIQHIVKSLKTTADDIVSDLGNDSTDADRAWFQSKNSDIHVRLMHLYLGYVNRVFYFYKKSIDRERRDPDAVKDALISLKLVTALEEAKADA
ncbi:hypothetical protein SE17_05525 [Kouleothrix aurantiaca]|uniref:Uncharacterized protein n=1 Tax=Kouleothrix aurantiaca TaxID=186479 RepID=A0A0P9D8J2_9CHLR|nr:hypothetical protein SE17_05525 [Kouleothrix aurantiaca]